MLQARFPRASRALIGAAPHSALSALRAVSIRRAPRICCASTEAGAPTAPKIVFKITKHVGFGQTLHVVGSIPELGSWNADNALALTWGEGDVWSAEVKSISSDIQYKYIIRHKRDQARVDWQDGDNLSVQLAAAAAVVLNDRWSSGRDSIEVTEEAGEVEAAAPATPIGAQEEVAPTPAAEQEVTPIAPMAAQEVAKEVPEAAFIEPAAEVAVEPAKEEETVKAVEEVQEAATAVAEEVTASEPDTGAEEEPASNIVPGPAIRVAPEADAEAAVEAAVQTAPSKSPPKEEKKKKKSNKPFGDWASKFGMK